MARTKTAAALQIVETEPAAVAHGDEGDDAPSDEHALMLAATRAHDAASGARGKLAKARADLAHAPTRIADAEAALAYARSLSESGRERERISLDAATATLDARRHAARKSADEVTAREREATAAADAARAADAALERYRDAQHDAERRAVENARDVHAAALDAATRAHAAAATARGEFTAAEAAFAAEDCARTMARVRDAKDDLGFAELRVQAADTRVDAAAWALRDAETALAAAIRGAAERAASDETFFDAARPHLATIVRAARDLRAAVAALEPPRDRQGAAAARARALGATGVSAVYLAWYVHVARRALAEIADGDALSAEWDHVLTPETARDPSFAQVRTSLVEDDAMRARIAALVADAAGDTDTPTEGDITIDLTDEGAAS